MPSAEAQAVHEALRNRPSGPPDLAVMREAAEQRETLTAEPAVEAEAAAGIWTARAPALDRIPKARYFARASPIVLNSLVIVVTPWPTITHSKKSS